MNTSILICSLKYTCKFELIVSISNWIYNELLDINCTNDKLKSAYIKNDFEVLRLIVQHLPVSEEQQKINNEMLEESCIIGCIETVKILIESGSSGIQKVPRCRTVDIHFEEDSPVRFASCYGHTDIVKLLMKAGADIRAYDNYALRLSNDNGHLEVVKLLMENGANLRDSDVLVYASFNGHIDIVKYVLSVDKDISAAHCNVAIRCAKNTIHYHEVVRLVTRYLSEGDY